MDSRRMGGRSASYMNFIRRASAFSLGQPKAFVAMGAFRKKKKKKPKQLSSKQLLIMLHLS